MSQNEAFHRACLAWLHAAIRVLSTVSPVVREDVEITLTPNGWSSVGGDYKPDFQSMIARAADRLYSLPEFEAIVGVITETPVLSSALCTNMLGQPIPEGAHQREEIARYLDRFLLEFMTGIPGKDGLTDAAVEATFEHIYDQLERFIYTTEPQPVVWFWFVRNLTSQIEAVRLDSEVGIRQATPEERIKILKDAHRWPMGNLPDAPEAFVEVHHALDRFAFPDQQVAMDTAQAVVLALRLLKPNPVGIWGARWRAIDQPFRRIPVMGIGPFVPWGTFMGEPYILTEDDANELGKLWPKVRRAIKDDELSTAITRFRDSYERTKDTDKLIDYWTALESLFLPPDSHVQDMGETAAMVVAHYLGRNAGERDSIRNDIKRSHALRSHLVHGKRGQLKHDLAEMVAKTGNHLRHGLRKRFME